MFKTPLTALILIFLSTIAYGKKPIDINDEKFEGAWLGPYASVYIGDETIDQVIEPSFASKFFDNDFLYIILRNPGSSLRATKPVWVRFDVTNSGDKSQTFVLDALSWPFDFSEFYVNGQLRDRMVIGGRQERFFSTQIEPHQEASIHIRIGDGLTSNLLVFSWRSKTKYFIRELETKNYYTMTYSIIGMSILFNLLVFLAYRDRTYLSYIMYLVFLGLWNYSVTNIARQIWGSNDGIAVTASLMGLFALLFSMEFLNLKRYKKLYAIAKVLLAFSVINVLVSIFDSKLGFLMVHVTSMFGSPFCLLCGIIISLRERQIHAYIYSVAFGTFLIGVLMTVLFNQGMVSDLDYLGGMQSGALIENILMMVAMGQKIYQSERQRKHSYGQLAKVFFPHQLKQMKAGQTLENTMPVGEKEACILAFDVINSSAIEEESFAHSWEEFMSHCRAIMMDGYDIEKLASTGYMIKEMGDGFLCSIGYPFDNIGDNLSQDAVQLAENMTLLFHKLMNPKGCRQEVHCSIGIAKGTVRGYFSKSGAIRHDLWGPAVVHATRYESIRKKLFLAEGLEENHIITLQQTVYHGLPTELQISYKLIDLETTKLKVRNDQQATHLAYRIGTKARPRAPLIQQVSNI
ncbi:7TM diverse intracellular signaling domain-containing protein [Pseudobacteriovorax antillogorgiicola]|uniref:Adenylate and Guanylate cyclase catalytic domain-containing protein n=1 Tax=Pseudobacteriovorax antillogorgiicola TaxID=1513793 RepID=A0A1Y6BRZ8_9BACT|nr:7TM diverse intracellular signaling domain-containing protein [Pseudobacteriovorax antillogorgiicola]TCS54586.1 adenylate/guanylate cyclase family protein [Pseudobacteriovorax antillogorgiicola]SMF17813.1 Adenylate and Guanylate cyclase catalytic domain-containing protein [Pseudobacteriovorax antillogorgiicola]